MNVVNDLEQQQYAARNNLGPVLSSEQVNKVMPENNGPIYKSNLMPDEIQADIINGDFDKKAYNAAMDMMNNPQNYIRPKETQTQNNLYNNRPVQATNEQVQRKPDLTNILNSFKERLKNINNQNVPQNSFQNADQNNVTQPEKKTDMFDNMFNAQPETKPNEGQTGMNNTQQNLPLADRMRSAFNENEYNQIDSGLKLSNDVINNLDKFRNIAKQKGYDPDEMQQKLLSMSQEDMIDILAGKYNAPNKEAQNNNMPYYRPLNDLPGGTITNGPTVNNNSVQTNQGKPYREKWLV